MPGFLLKVPGFKTLAGVVRAGKSVAKVKAAFSDTEANPKPETKFDSVFIDVANLVRGLKSAHEDGKVTRDEMVDFLVEVAMIVLRQLLGVKLKKE